MKDKLMKSVHDSHEIQKFITFMEVTGTEEEMNKALVADDALARLEKYITELEQQVQALEAENASLRINIRHDHAMVESKNRDITELKDQLKRVSDLIKTMALKHEEKLKELGKENSDD